MVPSTENYTPSYTGFQFNFQCLREECKEERDPQPGQSFVSHEEYPAPYNPTFDEDCYFELYCTDDR